MFSREPTVILGAVSEIARAVVPTLIIFGVISWTSEQTAQFLLLIGVVIGSLTVVLTRSQVRPESDVNALIRTATQQQAGTSPEKVKEIQAEKDEEGK